jgi:hypothetical protein
MTRRALRLGVPCVLVLFLSPAPPAPAVAEIGSPGGSGSSEPWTALPGEESIRVGVPLSELPAGERAAVEAASASAEARLPGETADMEAYADAVERSAREGAAP